MGKDVIIACDFSSKEQVLGFLDRFTETKPFVKIGMELFYAEGPSIVREIKARGHKIFLDLKLHDIPNTVKKAMSVLRNLDVDMCNVHARYDACGRRGSDARGRNAPAAYRRDAAHVDERGAHAQRAAYRCDD